MYTMTDEEFEQAVADALEASREAIFAANEKDIEAAKAPFADYDTVKTQLAEAQKTIKGFQDQGNDIEAVRKSAKEWEDKYNSAIKDHEAKLADMAFDKDVEDAITKAKGKNAKAIRALLDVDTLKKSTNRAADIDAALKAVAKDNDYLFDDGGNPPPYSPGTGTGGFGGKDTGFNFGFTGVRARETGK